MDGVNYFCPSFRVAAQCPSLTELIKKSPCSNKWAINVYHSAVFSVGQGGVRVECLCFRESKVVHLFVTVNNKVEPTTFAYRWSYLTVFTLLANQAKLYFIGYSYQLKQSFRFSSIAWFTSSSENRRYRRPRLNQRATINDGYLNVVRCTTPIWWK